MLTDAMARALEFLEKWWGCVASYVTWVNNTVLTYADRVELYCQRWVEDYNDPMRGTMTQLTSAGIAALAEWREANARQGTLG